MIEAIETSIKSKVTPRMYFWVQSPPPVLISRAVKVTVLIQVSDEACCIHVLRGFKNTSATLLIGSRLLFFLERRGN